MTTGPNRPRIPVAAGGIQVNCCRNPLCSYFGVEPSAHSARGRSSPEKRDNYVLSGESGNVNLKCKSCGAFSRIKSNKAIHEELERILWPMQATRDLALSSDFLIYDGPRIHLIKPLVRRFWLERQAFDDARRIVESIGRSVNV